LGRFGPFRYYTNFKAKQDELVRLMHKIVQRSRVGIFRNERTQSTPFERKLMFWGVLDHFRYCTNFSAKWAELVRLMHNFVQ
jgi:hypothetical protein